MKNDSQPRDAGCNLLECFQHLAEDRKLEECEARGIAPWLCPTRHEALRHRIDGPHEYEGDRAGRLLHGGQYPGAPN